MKKFVAMMLVAVCVHPAWANGLDSLEQFVKTVNSGRADFTQVVTAPAKDGQAARSKTSTGTFEFSRPNRFRFIYKKPFEQSIVADGQTLWLHAGRRLGGARQIPVLRRQDKVRGHHRAY